MGCLLGLAALVFPRVALLAVWATTNYVDRAFETIIVPLLGFFILPLTTLVYALTWVSGAPFGGGRWIWLALAMVADLAVHVGALIPIGTASSLWTDVATDSARTGRPAGSFLKPTRE